MISKIKAILYTTLEAWAVQRLQDLRIQQTNLLLLNHLVIFLTMNLDVSDYLSSSGSAGRSLSPAECVDD